MTGAQSTSRLWFFAVAPCIWLWPTNVAAHSGPSLQGETFHGFLYPTGDPGHLLAALSVGALTYFVGRRGFWIIPAAYIIGIALGSAVGSANLSLIAVSSSLAISLVALGALLTIPEFLPVWLVVSVIGALGLTQGLSHSPESPASPGDVDYLAGVALGTAAAMAAGALLAYVQRTMRSSGGVHTVLRESPWDWSACSGLPANWLALVPYLFRHLRN